jgi:hypothetical protein
LSTAETGRAQRFMGRAGVRENSHAVKTHSLLPDYSSSWYKTDRRTVVAAEAPGLARGQRRAVLAPALPMQKRCLSPRR